MLDTAIGKKPAMRTLITLLFALAFAPLTNSLAADRATLKAAFDDKFRVGAAVGTHQVMGQEPASVKLVAEQFNTITPENLLKWQEVHPQPETYNFGPADAFVKLGEESDMFIVGHTLVWHNQTPDWAFAGVGDKSLDRETALARIKSHIDTVVGRYKGRIHAWDVVNEAIDDNGRLRSGAVGPPGRRGEPWHAAIGDDYIEKAFEFAHAADPDAELYYNDFNEWHPAKIKAISELVRSLKTKGIRIDGLGLQGHWGMDYPSIDEIDHMLTEYGKLGVKLMITELDISVIPPPGQNTGAEVTDRAKASDAANPYADELPAEQQEALAKRYGDVFEVFVKHADKIDRVTFWGVHDGHSWRNDWPIRGRSDYPLLFDRKLKPKPALDAVIKTAGAASE
jgi:endo-1,4-beta-xylanase